jgi:hypothetical protein
MIIKVLGCNEAHALRVYNELCCMGVSLSNASKKKLTQYIREADQILQLTAKA